MTIIMIIGIDGNEANQKIRAGSGVYAYNLFWQIYRQVQNSKLKCQIYLKDNPINELPPPTNYWEYKVIGPKKFWTQLGLPIQLWMEKVMGKLPDVFFSLTHYAPRFCPVPSVITIFDLSFTKFPEMFLKEDLYKLKNWTEYSVRQAKKIITISQFSKNEIVEYYNISENKVVVAYPGYDVSKFNIEIKNQKSKIKNTNKKLKINGEYILYVGTIQPRKNLKRLIEAFKKLNDNNLKLVIAGMIDEGRGGWMQEELFKKIKNEKLKMENEIIITGYVSEDDLPYLMVGAKALVLPSLYEGFGIPVVEAMACGVPVVVSNVSSLPEVVGEAGILVDSLDLNSIKTGIHEACFNMEKRKQLIKMGLERIKLFSWDETAKIILKELTGI